MGRPIGTKYIETPEKLYELFEKYREETKSNPRKKHVFVGKDGNSDNERLERPLTMEGFRVLKVNNINYDVYVSFVIGDNEYWGVINKIMTQDAELESEVFKDYDLYQAKEWIIKIKGLVIKTIKEWLKPEPGNYKLLNDEVICYSVETGKQLSMEKGIEIEVIRAYDNKIVVRHESETYNLVGDNYVYFNWWFEKID